MPAADARPVSEDEARALFAGLVAENALILAVSGGPDSTALLVLAARWRTALKRGPKLLAVTVDHGLRTESAREALQVKRLAGRLGVMHTTKRWIGPKPKTRIQEEAREARYQLLGEAARRAHATHVLTAHTLDDQAETVLFRMARGSGLSGLAGMARSSAFGGIVVVRPFIDIPKSRLIATLDVLGVSYAHDLSNLDERFARPRWRALMPALADEGLDARRVATLAKRIARADQAIEAAVDEAWMKVPVRKGRVGFDATHFAKLPEEIGLRLLGRAIERVGIEGPVKLGKLEALFAAVSLALTSTKPVRLQRTLAGAVVSLERDCITISPAPKRRSAAKRHSPNLARLT